MPSLSVKLFGHPIITIGDKPTEIKRRKGLAIIAYLAATGEVQGREFLATLLWPESDQSRSRAGLRSALFSINKSEMSEWLMVDKEFISLELGSADQVDVLTFSRLLAEVDSHQHSLGELCESCFSRLETAVGLYTDDFLAGFTLENAPSYDEWQFFLGDALKRQQKEALSSLLSQIRHEKRLEQAIPYAKRLLALDSLDEEAQRQLIRLYAQVGQKSAALRQYQQCLNLLEQELGLPPEDQTVALFEEISNGTVGPPADINFGAGTDLKSTKAVPHNLPSSSTSFVGRHGEVARVKKFLADPNNRLLTIVGPGGMGKTRLALDVAHSEREEGHFSDGIYFVGLSRLEEPSGIVPAIAESVGLALLDGNRSPRQQLLDYLRNKSQLLILDNFEHLLSGAELAADLLNNGPGLHILATSRERLNLYEEQRYPLGGLDYPEEAEPEAMKAAGAVKLFVQRAQQRIPDFTLEPDDYAPLLEICRLVEGMPLGLELAATWADVFSLTEIVAEIEKSIDFLETDLSNVPARHRNIRAVIDASWQRLTPEEKKIFAKLSIFKGGFSPNAAEAVAGGSRKSLIRLVNQSLLRFDRDHKRYDIHELLRQFGSKKLHSEDYDATLLTHATYFCQFLAARRLALRGKDQEKIIDEIELEIDNCFLAWRSATEMKHVPLLEEGLSCLGSYLIYNGRYADGESIIRGTIEHLYAYPKRPETGNSLEIAFKIHLWEWHSRFLRHLKRFEQATESMAAAVSLLESADLDDKTYRQRRAILLLERARLNRVQEFGGSTIEYALESLAIFRSLEDTWGAGLTLELLSLYYNSIGQFEKAEELAHERLAIQQQYKNRRGIGRTYALLGRIYFNSNRLARSEAVLRKSMVLLQEGRHRVDATIPMVYLSAAYLFSGKFEQSLSLAFECLALFNALGIPSDEGISVSIERSLLNLGRYAEAERHAKQHVERFREENSPWAIGFIKFNHGRIALAQGKTTQAISHFSESCSLLRQFNDLTILVEVLLIYACALMLTQKRSEAIKLLIEGLRIMSEVDGMTQTQFHLPAMALLQLNDGNIERAIEFYAAGLKSAYISNSIWFEEVIGQRISKAAESLQPDVIEAAKARGQAKDFLQTAREILAELNG